MISTPGVAIKYSARFVGMGAKARQVVISSRWLLESTLLARSAATLAAISAVRKPTMVMWELGSLNMEMML